MADWVAHWKAGGEAWDARAAAEALTEDAELISPLTDRFSFRGQEVIQVRAWRCRSAFHRDMFILELDCM